MHPIFSSLNIQNILLKFPEFLNLQWLGHKLHGYSLSQAIFDNLFSCFGFIPEEKYLMFKCLILLLELSLLFSCSRMVLLLY